MWEIYDALINGIPENLKVDELVCGKKRTYLRSGNGAGIAASRPYETRMPLLIKDMIGLPLREVAGCIKSWNFVEAAVGVAAVNAYYNNPQVARANGVEFSDKPRVEDRRYDPFIMSQNQVKGKKVAVIGHFPYIEKLLAPVCDFSIIEWTPENGDFPMPASEYILPECDYVYITCAAVVDKTLPRFLELSKNARGITIVGPGTPLAPVLFDYGVDDLSGFIIKDQQRAFKIASGAENIKINVTGQKVAFKKEIR
ncbi:Rossmann-like domain-containing protein [Acetobacterium woodii]|uniref:DUF364 domain-containing protein n=1 Tax=Acetobacterium woodii (strain ATCC 29683 / DSM 1030 / JCM 2381 / KCTC 1655 / WB1) TaxID=931626 RepID=H6LFW2_ACEWD|nr:DUF364 domain-containing protein [Acetobacterium woodii]AFA48250.1 hypothetical protein DUF364 [Acetobacterium woodii DSM 1030]